MVDSNTDTTNDGVLKSTWSKVVAGLAALGLGAGLTFAVTRDGCSVKSVAADAGMVVDAGVDSVDSGSTSNQ